MMLAEQFSFSTLAYIDPGVGIIVVQFLIAALAGVLIFFREKVFSAFRRKRSEEDVQDEATSE